MPGPRMPAWGILPVTLPAFTITGMWIVPRNRAPLSRSECGNARVSPDRLWELCHQPSSCSARAVASTWAPIHVVDEWKVLVLAAGAVSPGYAMALSNNHICPVHNWNYNQSCDMDGPSSCCTLDHIPLVSKCGTLPPESCFFSLICSLGSFMVILVGLLRYAHLLERLGPSLLNTLGLATGWVCAAGLTMVGNFQVDHAKVLHYIGAGVAFPTSMLFLLLQSILTYRVAKTRGQYWTGHLRSILTAVAFFTLVFTGVFFIQESFVLQHVAALCEWMFIIDVLVFYGTFTFEFGAISTDTFLVLLKASRAPKSYKGESGVSSMAHIHSHVEGLAMA
ncbi:transmembrane protein 150A isoform X1 [Pithys albifrons albifrons]|uniref:transmembrane protein 150A isoform X1 n=1 Tax=Pithys albifrons albifrons TaxID=3385563 RepID=UPI003A5CDA56